MPQLLNVPYLNFTQTTTAPIDDSDKERRFSNESIEISDKKKGKQNV